jgi:hypothetical protein
MFTQRIDRTEWDSFTTPALLGKKLLRTPSVVKPHVSCGIAGDSMLGGSGR